MRGCEGVRDPHVEKKTGVFFARDGKENSTLSHLQRYQPKWLLALCSEVEQRKSYTFQTCKAISQAGFSHFVANHGIEQSALSHLKRHRPKRFRALRRELCCAEPGFSCNSPRLSRYARSQLRISAPVFRDRSVPQRGAQISLIQCSRCTNLMHPIVLV